MYPVKEKYVSLLTMNYPAAEQRGIRCHAGPDPASSLDFWIPAVRQTHGLEPVEGLSPE